MTKQEFIAKYEGWLSYTHREELKKQMENDLEAVFQKLNESPILEESKQFNCSCGSALPNGWMDWNKLTLDQMVEYLRKKYMFSSSGDAKCIYHLIEFYDNHK